MKIIMNQKKLFNHLILLSFNMVVYSQFAIAENDSNNYLDLSTVEIRNISIELNSYCTPKNSLNEIYGNGKHNIPLDIKIVAIGEHGEQIAIKKDDILKFSKIQAKEWGEDVSLSNETNEDSKNSISVYSDKYTKCIGENGSSFSVSKPGIYFKSTATGKTVDLGVKFYYQDKNGKHAVSASDSERLKINVLQNPLSTVSSEALFSIKLMSEYYDSILVNRNNYRLFKIFPLVDKFPSLVEVELSKIRLTNKDTGDTSGLVATSFYESKYLMPINYFVQSRGWYGQYKRSFISGYLISGLKKTKPQSDTIILGNKNDIIFSLNEISSQDFGFVTISNSGIPLHVWEYQWFVPFLLELSGYDSYGNYFLSHLQEQF